MMFEAGVGGEGCGTLSISPRHMAAFGMHTPGKVTVAGKLTHLLCHPGTAGLLITRMTRHLSRQPRAAELLGCILLVMRCVVTESSV